jgi:ketosteroid isomerase-like protein
MSRENVEVLKALCDAGNRGDREAFLDGLDPAAEWHVTGVVLDQQRVYRGREAIWDYISTFAEEFAQFRVEPEDFFEIGDTVVVVARLIGRGRVSGATVDLRFASVVTFRDGRILRGENYAETEQALEAAGLEE